MASRSWSRGASLLAVAVVLSGARPAAAQSPGDEALLRAGVEHRRAGRDADALAAFREALALRRTPRAIAQVALAEQALSSWVDAEEHLREALSEEQDPWIRQNRPALESAARLIAGKLAWLSVRSNVDDATLYVGGRPLGPVAERSRVRAVAGQVTVELRRASGASQVRAVLLVPEEEAHLTIDFAEDAAASRSPVKARADAPEPRPSSLSRVAGFATGGAGLLGLGAGVVFGLRAASFKRERDADCARGCTAAGVAADRDGRSAALVSTVAFVAGAGLATLGVVLVLTAPSDKATVAVSAGAGSVTLEGRF